MQINLLRKMAINKNANEHSSSPALNPYGLVFVCIEFHPNMGKSYAFLPFCDVAVAPCRNAF